MPVLSYLQDPVYVCHLWGKNDIHFLYDNFKYSMEDLKAK